MNWWKKLFGRPSDASIDGLYYRVSMTLYSADGERAAEVREFENGETYLFESELVDGDSWKERLDGAMVGPFRSLNHAERFITTTDWFTGE